MGNESVQRRDDSRTDFFCAAICPIFIFDIQTVVFKTPRNVTRCAPPLCKLVYNVVGIFRANKNILIHNKI